MKSLIYATLMTAVLASPLGLEARASECGGNGKVVKQCPADQWCSYELTKVPGAPGRCVTQPKNVARDMACGGGLKNICPGGQICSYEGIFPVTATTKGKCAPQTPVLSQSCGTRGASPCPAGYKCEHKADPRKIADAPGKCVKQEVTIFEDPILPIAKRQGQVCGTRGASACPAGTVCDKSPSDRTDAAGHCIVRTHQTAPVSSPPSSGQICGTRGASACPVGTVCNKSPSDRTDAAGQCVAGNPRLGGPAVAKRMIPIPCGGIAGITCPVGYKCSKSGNLGNVVADAMGQCVQTLRNLGPMKPIAPAVEPIAPAVVKRASKCGGIAGLSCDAGFRCSFPRMAIPIADQMGDCVPFKPAKPVEPTVSILPFLPGNDKPVEGQPIVKRGGKCGGFAGLTCDAGFKCSYAGNPAGVADMLGNCIPDGKIGTPVNTVPKPAEPMMSILPWFPPKKGNGKIETLPIAGAAPVV